MKRIVGWECVFILCMMFILVLGMDMEVAADTVIPKSEFEDDSLYEYVMSNFDYNADGKLEQSEAEAVRKIELYVGELFGDMSTIDELSSIKGLEYFTNVTFLIINNGDNTHITDISVISKLTKLKELRIRSVRSIVDFSPISSLVNLETLDLGDSNCTDISFLSGLTKLKYLDLGWNEIKNAYVISSLTNMKELHLYNCGLTNILFLKGLNKLTDLSLDGNEIYDFNILTGVSGTLKVLNIGNCMNDGYQLTPDELQFLKEMDNLVCLSMIYSGITQIPDLSELPMLTSVSLHGNSLYMKDVVSNLPSVITSRNNWISETGMNTQVGTNEVITTSSSDMNGTTESETTKSNVTEDTTTRRDNDDTGEEETSRMNSDVQGQPEEETDENEVSIDEMDNGQQDIREDNTDDTQERDDLSQSDSDNQDNLNVSNNIEDIRANFEIYMSGLFPSGIYVVAKEIEDIKEYIYDIRKLYSMVPDVTEVKLYDIAVYDKLTHKRVQPIGEVKVSIRLKEFKNADYYVYRLNEYGEWITMESYVSNDMIHFYSDHFSIFSIVISELMQEEDNSGKDIEDKVKGDGSDIKDNTIATRRQMGLAAVVAIVVVIIVYEMVKKLIIKKE